MDRCIHPFKSLKHVTVLKDFYLRLFSRFSNSSQIRTYKCPSFLPFIAFILWTITNAGKVRNFQSEPMIVKIVYLPLIKLRWIT